MKRSHTIGLALLALFLGLRLAHLEADPPTHYPTGRFAQELYVEGPAKAHEARRFGLFGTFETRTADNYRIWSTQSPAYVLPLSGFFRLFGAGYVQLRIFCALAASLGFAVFLLLARQHGNPLVAPIAGLLFACSFFDVQLTRSGLLEPYLDGLLALSFLTGLLALRNLRWLAASHAAFAAALLTKQTALFALPPLLALGVAAHLRARRRGASPGQHLAVLGAGLGLAAALLLYVRSPAYWETVRWNFGHMIVGVEQHRQLSLGAVKLLALLDRIATPERWVEGALYIAPLLPLALVPMGRAIQALVRRRPVEMLDLVAGGWLLCALVALQLTEHVRPRFSLVLLPPAALLAASALAWLATLRAHPLLRAAPLALAAVVALATDLRWQARWWSTPTYQLRDAGAQLGELLGRDDVVVGAWAPVLGFDTAADTFYVKGPFNTSRAAFTALGVTHLLLRQRDHTGARVKRLAPAAWSGRKRELELPVLDERITLFRLPRQQLSGDPPQSRGAARSSPGDSESK
ncbi:glycosyltransferase family 39 protein [Vulgatibacter sp.]|uniref:glycosyltransferase family 39 protein n=1 Tax=Vulgatibacter sp. TaxID=1971226 RepID=UPI00356B1537